MPEDDPTPNNPLGPYFPSEVPTVPGNERKWVALLVAAMLLALLLGQLLRLLIAVFG